MKEGETMDWPSLVVDDDIVAGVARHDVVDPPPSTPSLSVPIEYSNVHTLVCTLQVPVRIVELAVMLVRRESVRIQCLLCYQ